jgi:hypothetical protein
MSKIMQFLKKDTKKVKTQKDENIDNLFDISSSTSPTNSLK